MTSSISARVDRAAIIEHHLDRLLSTRQYPKTICPSEVARAFSAAELHDSGTTEWRDLMPDIRQMVWERRDRGEVEILQKGEILPEDVALEDIKGPIRARKRQYSD